MFGINVYIGIMDWLCQILGFDLKKMVNFL